MLCQSIRLRNGKCELINGQLVSLDGNEKGSCDPFCVLKAKFYENYLTEYDSLKTKSVPRLNI